MKKPKRPAGGSLSRNSGVLPATEPRFGGFGGYSPGLGKGCRLAYLGSLGSQTVIRCRFRHLLARQALIDRPCGCGAPPMSYPHPIGQRSLGRPPAHVEIDEHRAYSDDCLFGRDAFSPPTRSRWIAASPARALGPRTATTSRKRPTEAVAAFVTWW